MPSQLHSIAAEPEADAPPARPPREETALQDYLSRAHGVLASHWGCRRMLLRPSPGAPGETAPATVTEMLPGLLADVAIDPPEDVLLIAPARLADDGAYRLGLIRLARRPLDAPALGEMLRHLLGELAPARPYRLLPERRALTRDAMALDMLAGPAWHRLGHCGRLEAATLEAAGLPPRTYSAVLVELGLDRLHALDGVRQ